jgi:hypothetical protein
MTNGDSDLRLGFATGTCAAALWALPVTLRVAPEIPSSPVVVYLGLLGSAAATLGPVVAFGRVSWARAGEALRSLLVGCGLSTLPLAVFATLLHQGTHHRPLGAATFGIVAMAGLVVTLAGVRRVRRWAQDGPRPWVSAGSSALALLSFGTGVLWALRDGPPNIRTALLDVALGTVAVGALLRWRKHLLRRAAPAGVVLWGLATAIGIALLLLDESLWHGLRAGAPVTLGIVGVWVR